MNKLLTQNVLPVQKSSTRGLVLGSPARSRELDCGILMGPFQLEIFYDSTQHFAGRFAQALCFFKERIQAQMKDLPVQFFSSGILMGPPKPLTNSYHHCHLSVKDFTKKPRQ